MTLERIRASSTTAAQVSSQEVSSARTRTTARRRLGADRSGLEPHDERVLAVVVVVATAVPRGPEPESLVHRDRGAVGGPHFQRVAAFGAGRLEELVDQLRRDPLTAPAGVYRDVHEVPDVSVARAHEIADEAVRVGCGEADPRRLREIEHE